MLNSIRKIKRKLWLDLGLTPVTDIEHGSTALNILHTFPAFKSNSYGSYKVRSQLAIQTINRFIPACLQLLQDANLPIAAAIDLASFPLDQKAKAISLELKRLFDQQGSDKATHHNYHLIYGFVLADLHTPDAILEIGIGTNQPDVVSTMGTTGTPGASLRAFRDHFANTNIYGADIDKRIFFEEDRIQCLYLDQTDPDSFDEIDKLLPAKLDLIIDDGLHSPDSNILTLAFALRKLKDNGWAVIEDISKESANIWLAIAAIMRSQGYLQYLFRDQESYVFILKQHSQPHDN